VVWCSKPIIGFALEFSRCYLSILMERVNTLEAIFTMLIVLTQRESSFPLLKPGAHGIELIREDGEQSRDTVKEDGGNP